MNALRCFGTILLNSKLLHLSLLARHGWRMSYSIKKIVRGNEFEGKKTRNEITVPNHYSKDPFLHYQSMGRQHRSPFLIIIFFHLSLKAVCLCLKILAIFLLSSILAISMDDALESILVPKAWLVVVLVLSIFVDWKLAKGDNDQVGRKLVDHVLGM